MYLCFDVCCDVETCEVCSLSCAVVCLQPIMLGDHRLNVEEKKQRSEQGGRPGSGTRLGGRPGSMGGMGRGGMGGRGGNRGGFGSSSGRGAENSRMGGGGGGGGGRGFGVPRAR